MEESIEFQTKMIYMQFETILINIDIESMVVARRLSEGSIDTILLVNQTVNQRLLIDLQKSQAN